MNDYAERVARGVLWLDHMHDGWREKVNLETLDLSRSASCVLAQVTGRSYWHAIENLLGGDRRYAEEMGFDSPVSVLYGINFLMDWEYAHLENEWRKVLAK